MKTNWWNSLRTKIIAWSFVPTVIILSAVAWFTFYSYQKVIGDLAIKQDWGIVQSRTQPLYQAFFDITNPLIVEIILQVDTQKEAPLEVRAQNILDHAQGIDIFDGGIYFVDQGIKKDCTEVKSQHVQRISNVVHGFIGPLPHHLQGGVGCGCIFLADT